MKPIGVVLTVVSILLLCVAVGGYTYGVRMESNDAFCASCHTEPETTYYQQSQQPEAPTLAAFHTHEDTRCIDCHSGKGVAGRLQAMMTGALDMLAFRSGRYTQPARTTRPVGNVGCTKCHNMPLIPRGEPGEDPSKTGEPGYDGHYHADSLEALWRVRGGPKNRCTLCHPAHAPGDAQQAYMHPSAVEQGCRGCHQALGEGPGGEAGERD